MLIGLGFVATIVSIAAEPRCTPEVPCAPELTSASLPLLGVALAVGWWFPVLAAVAAVTFALIEVLSDPNAVSGIVIPIWAALHLGHAVYVQRARSAQARQAVAAMVPIPSQWQRPVERGVTALWRSLLIGGLAVGVLVAAVTWGIYRSQARDNAELAAGSTVVEARVIETIDGDSMHLRLAPSPAVPGIPDSFELSVLDEYAVGDVVPIRINPTDPGWTHLVAEPPDPTGWLLLGVLALVLGLGASGVAIWTDLQRRMLTARPPTVGLPVRVLRVPFSGWTGLAAVDTNIVWARTVLALPRAEAETVPGVARVGGAGPDPDDDIDPDPQWGFVIGEVRDGGQVAVLTGDIAVTAAGPLRVLRDLPEFDKTWSIEDDEREELDAIIRASEPLPIDATDPSMPLPWRGSPTTNDILKGLGQIVLGVGIAAFLAWDARAVSVAQAVLVGITGIVLFTRGLDTLFTRACIDQSAVTLHTTWRTNRVPLPAIEQVRRSDDAVVLILGSTPGDLDRTQAREDEVEDDEDIVVLEVGPEAGRLARAIDLARDRNSGTDRAGQPVHVTTRWRSTALLAVVVVLAQVVASAWAVVT